MTAGLDIPEFERALSDLEARVTAVAAAIVQAGANDLQGEVEHLFGDDAEVSVEPAGDGFEVKVDGIEPVLREFGTRTRPAAPWINDTIIRTAAGLKRKGER